MSFAGEISRISKISKLSGLVVLVLPHSGGPLEARNSATALESLENRHFEKTSFPKTPFSNLEKIYALSQLEAVH